MDDFKDLIRGYLGWFMLVALLIFMFRVLALLVDEPEKAKFNECRTAGGSVVSCFTGLK